MASFIRRVAPYEYLTSKNSPDYPTATWLKNPDLSGVSGVEQIYWKVVADTVVEMNQTEKDAVDAAIAAADQAALELQISANIIVPNPGAASTDIFQFVENNPIWTDSETGLGGPPDMIEALNATREIFGLSSNPLCPSGYPENILGRISNIESIHGKLGWHSQLITESRYYRPSDLMIYYGWLNSFNSGVSGWDNEKVARDLARYGQVVIGEGLVKLYATGSHTGADGAAVLADSGASWTASQWVGYRLYNTTDGSSGAITANTATTVTATLAGGTDNDWDTSDVYEIRHGDYANTSVIIPRIKQYRPGINIFGYVDGTFSQANFESACDEWDTAGVHGIFIDRAGYDFGTSTTNSRTAMNTKIEYVHDLTTAKLVFANAGNEDHLLGTVNDTSYPNTTYNSGLVAGSLSDSDWYLIESLAINTDAYTGTGGYEARANWAARILKAIGHRATYGVNTAACGIILDAHASGQALFDFGFTSALMASLDAWGVSDTSYGASSAKGKLWTRPDVSKMGIINWINPSIQVDSGDSDVYWRYVQFGRFKVDFSSTAETSAFEKW